MPPPSKPSCFRAASPSRPRGRIRFCNALLHPLVIIMTLAPISLTPGVLSPVWEGVVCCPPSRFFTFTPAAGWQRDTGVGKRGKWRAHWRILERRPRTPGSAMPALRMEARTYLRRSAGGGGCGSTFFIPAEGERRRCGCRGEQKVSLLESPQVIPLKPGSAMSPLRR